MKQRGSASILLIILGLFIIFIIVGYFKDNKLPNINIVDNSGSSLNNQDSKNHPLAIAYTSCGINIESPLDGGVIDKIFAFKGKVSGCGWTIQNGFIGTFELIDPDKKSLTDKINVPATTNGEFSISVAIKNQTSFDFATVYLQSNDGMQIATFNVYLK